MHKDTHPQAHVCCPTQRNPPPPPRFYPPAVKCNPEPALLSVLEALGCGFDCASQMELTTVVSRMGVSPDRVIFANPCKRPADIALARKLGVERTTFDTECELLKIAATYPSAGCVLRLRCDDAGAQVGGLDRVLACMQACLCMCCMHAHAVQLTDA